MSRDTDKAAARETLEEGLFLACEASGAMKLKIATVTSLAGSSVQQVD
jgi:hypothetical protein